MERKCLLIWTKQLWKRYQILLKNIKPDFEEIVNPPKILVKGELYNYTIKTSRNSPLPFVYMDEFTEEFHFLETPDENVNTDKLRIIVKDTFGKIYKSKWVEIT